MNMLTSLLLLGIVLGHFVSGDVKVDTPTPRSNPGLNAPRKLWWLKEVTPDIYVAGRLTDRDIKYVSEGGFKSIVSLFRYDEGSKFAEEDLPSSVEAARVAEISGLQYEVVLDPDEEWATIEAVKKFKEVIEKVKFPAVVHSNRGYSAAFVTLMYLANKTRYDEKFTPRVDSAQFYRTAAVMGLDFTSNHLKRLVAEVTGQRFVEDPPRPNMAIKEWYNYWQAAPVYKNYFTAGQFRKSQVPGIIAAGYKAIIQMRPGVTTDGVPTQEPVTLLNVKDTSPRSTYGDNDLGPRQQPETLEKITIDPDKDKNYISPDSQYNFEVKNEEEFGDDIGLNLDTETEFFKDLGFPFYHMPIVLQVPYTPETFAKYKDQILKLGKEGPVLVHCAIGMRAGYMAVLAAALQYEKDMDWALKKIRELGFTVSPEVNSDVYNMYKAYLDKEVSEETRDEL